VAKVEYRKRVISIFPAWEEEVTKEKIACKRFFLAWVGLEASGKKRRKSAIMQDGDLWNKVKQNKKTFAYINNN
jgi:hypothetical protein